SRGGHGHVPRWDVLLRPGQGGAALPHSGALLYSGAGGAEQVLAGLRGGDVDPIERLQAFIRHHVGFFAAHMAEMKVLSHEANSLAGERQRKVSAIKRRYVDLLERLLRDVAPDDPAVERSAAAYVLFGMMNWIYNWYDPAGEIDPERLAGLIARIFGGGFAEARSTVHGG